MTEKKSNDFFGSEIGLLCSMELEDHYGRMYTNGMEAIRSGSFKVDDYLNGQPDDRYGLTLRIKLRGKVVEEIKKLINALNENAPGQYYYSHPRQDLIKKIAS